MRARIAAVHLLTLILHRPSTLTVLHGCSTLQQLASLSRMVEDVTRFGAVVCSLLPLREHQHTPHAHHTPHGVAHTTMLTTTCCLHGQALCLAASGWRTRATSHLLHSPSHASISMCWHTAHTASGHTASEHSTHASIPVYVCVLWVAALPTPQNSAHTADTQHSHTSSITPYT